MHFKQGNVAFEVPRHWEDKSIVAFAAPKTEGQEQSSNVVMTKDRLDDGETLDQYADRQLAELTDRVDDFMLADRAPRLIDGHEAIELRFSSRGRNGPLTQRLLIAQAPTRQLYCFTTTTPTADAVQMGPLFDRILESLSFAADAEATSAAVSEKDGGAA